MHPKTLSTFIKLSGSIDKQVEEATGLKGQNQLLKKIKSRRNTGEAITILVNTPCSQNCNHCFFVEKNQRPFEATPRATRGLHHLISQLKSMGYKPSIYPREIALVDNFLPELKGLQIDRVLSNGVLLSRSKISNLKSFGIKRVEISLHGNQKEHSLLTGNPPVNYKNIIRGITAAVEAGLDVSIFSTVFKGRVDTLSSFFKFAKGLGVKKIDLIRLIPVGRAQLLKDNYFLDEGDVRKILFAVDESRLQNSSLKISLFSTSFGPNFYSEGVYRYLAGQTGQEFSPYLCPWITGHYLGVSLGSRNVYPCFQALPYPELMIGQIDGGGLHISQPGLSAESLDKNLRGNCAAHTCPYHAICLGGCRISAYSVAKRKGEKDPLYAGMDLCVTNIISKMLHKGEISTL